MKKIFLLLVFIFTMFCVNTYAQNIVINKKISIQSTYGTLTIPNAGIYIKNCNVLATPIYNSGSAQYVDVTVSLNPVNPADLDITVYNHVWNDYTASGEYIEAYLKIEFQLCNNEEVILNMNETTYLNLFGEIIYPYKDRYYKK